MAILWPLETIGYTVSITAERAFVTDAVGKDMRGISSGLYTFSFFPGSALRPLAGGWLYDIIGHAMFFYLNTVVLILGSILVGLVLHEPTTETPKTQLLIQ